MPALPKGIEDKIYSELKKIKNHYDKKKKEKDFDRGECEIKIKNLFIQVFVELFYDYMNYLTVIDDYPVFDINCLLQNRPSCDEKFYKEFSETQLFQLFLQNVIKDESMIYFTHRVKQYLQLKKEKKTKTEIFAADFEKSYAEYYKVNQIYCIKPEFLKIEEGATINDISQLLIKKCPLNASSLNEKGVLKEDKRIIGSIVALNEGEEPKTYKYYQIPGSNIKVKEEEKKKKEEQEIDMNEIKEKSNTIMKNKNILVKGKKQEGNLSEREKEDIKDNIKDILTRAFKSEELNQDDTKNLVTFIDNSFGREFFLSAIFQKKAHERVTKNITKQCFNLLSDGIFNSLLTILKLDGNEKNFRDAIMLIKSTMLYFKSEKKKQIFICDILFEKLKNFSLISKDDLWEQWLDFDLQEKKELGIVFKDVQEEEKAICELLFDMTGKQMKLKRTKDNIFTSINNIAMNRIKTDKTYDEFKKKFVKMIK